MDTRKSFRVRVFEEGDPAAYNGGVITGIQINVPAGLTRQQAVDYVVGKVAHEFANYGAREALALGPTDNQTDWNEKVT